MQAVQTRSGNVLISLSEVPAVLLLHARSTHHWYAPERGPDLGNNGNPVHLLSNASHRNILWYRPTVWFPEWLFRLLRSDRSVCFSHFQSLLRSLWRNLSFSFPYVYQMLYFLLHARTNWHLHASNLPVIYSQMLLNTVWSDAAYLSMQLLLLLNAYPVRIRSLLTVHRIG